MTDLLSVAQLRNIMLVSSLPPVDAERWAPPLADAMARWGIASVPARAAFLAVCGEETRGFHGQRERLNYSAARMAAVWPRYSIAGTHPPQPTAEAVALAAQGEQAIANTVYAHMLGNGGPETGDGWDFRGGCPIQITGRGNWQACAAAHGLADLSRDELAGWADDASADPAQACSASAWFFAAWMPVDSHTPAGPPGLLPLADTGSEDDFIRAARRVGAPPPGEALELWKALWRRGVQVLGAEAA